MKIEKTLLYWTFLFLYTFSCGTKNSSKKEFIFPESEKDLLANALKDKLANTFDGEKNKAANFLIDNLYHNYNNSILQSNEYYYLHDLQNGNVQYFKDNIEQAFTAYKIRKKEISFNLFLEYVLPHRIEGEKSENWRCHVLRDFSGLKDTIDHLSAKESVSKINDELKRSFYFSSRELPSHTLSWTDLRSIGKGDCWSMAKIAVFSCRAFGLPVSIDFTPGWANINGGHAWNSLVTGDSSSTPFMGAEANPGEYDPLALYGSFKKTAKIFRKTYSIQKNKLLSNTGQNEHTPYPFNDPRIIDVTSQYLQTTEITLDLPFPASDKSFFYLCIYNNGDWIPVDWSENSSGSVAFKNLGKDIDYILGMYQDKTVIPIGSPMLLHNNNALYKLKPNYKKTIDIDIKTLQSLELDVLKLVNQGLDWEEFVSQIDELKKGNERSKPEIGKQYTLYYWSNTWINHQTVTVDKDLLIFKNAPSNSIYKVVDESTLSSKAGTERPFVYKDAEQIWY